MRGDWKDEAMQYRDVDRAAQEKAEEAMNQTRETPRMHDEIASHGLGWRSPVEEAIGALEVCLAELAETAERPNAKHYARQQAREAIARLTAMQL